MISVFNPLPVFLGNFSAAISPFRSRASSAANEVTNRVIWLIEAN